MVQGRQAAAGDHHLGQRSAEELDQQRHCNSDSAAALEVCLGRLYGKPLQAIIILDSGVLKS
jgi:hypothetical protein